MRKQWITAVMGLSLMGVGSAVVGCDKTVEDKKTVTKDPATGAQSTAEHKVSTTQGGGTKTEDTAKTTTGNP
jgi:hypothetical protein